MTATWTLISMFLFFMNIYVTTFPLPTLDLPGGQHTLSCVSQRRCLEKHQQYKHIAMASPKSRFKYHWKYLETLKIRIKRRISENKNAEDLKRIALETWTAVPFHYIWSLYDSIPRSILSVIRTKRQLANYWFII